MATKSLLALVLLFCLATAVVCGSLRITRISVPSRVAIGDSAILECDWVSNRKQVYSLKWYFGLKEFYRWTPAEQDPVQVFQVPAFDVDKSQSSRGKVVLRNLSRLAEGIMRCEISEEAPSFYTTANASSIEVVDLPDSPPMISPLAPLYQRMETVRLNCTSPNSTPPAKLSFFVNNEPVNPNSVGKPSTMMGQHHGFPLYTVTQELSVKLMPRLINRDGVVIVKCTAEIPGVYWETSEVRLPIDQPQKASIMEERSSSGSSCCAGIISSTLPLLLLLLWRSLLQ